MTGLGFMLPNFNERENKLSLQKMQGIFAVAKRLDIIKTNG
jgi:hypothetical protein